MPKQQYSTQDGGLNNQQRVEVIKYAYALPEKERVHSTIAEWARKKFNLSKAQLDEFFSERITIRVFRFKTVILNAQE
jgi:hypothetical protein